MSEAVYVEVDGGVLLVTLDRPKANAIDVSTSLALYEAFARLRDDDALRVGVVTGAGERFFSAGWDLKAAAAGEAVDADHGPGGFAGMTELLDLHKPVIAAVNGLALGGGFELVLAADLVVAASHAEFALPEVTLGLVPDSGGMLRLPRRLPAAVATEMLLTGRRMPASEALPWGLVNSVVPGESLMSSALGLARRVAEFSPAAVAAVLSVSRGACSGGVREGFAAMRGSSVYRAFLAGARGAAASPLL